MDIFPVVQFKANQGVLMGSLLSVAFRASTSYCLQKMGDSIEIPTADPTLTEVSHPVCLPGALRERFCICPLCSF
ncbi:hypothetical protein TNIN_369941 [Trichonephila inaurata madagascariensis]|uniref:Uncharacterized protein n=1 Tax=Trichonephila inaurata madagascariensis TaxID=2747483 RepID=A0A8X7BYE4_9ARAC|nr:hypothetical protein TNIN_369941 [Trichonephila inaurata madagascariensis]